MILRRSLLIALVALAFAGGACAQTDPAYKPRFGRAGKDVVWIPEPDDTERVKLCASWCVAHLYVVPAKVAGTWRLGDGELTLEQQFQNVSGTYRLGAASAPVTGLLRGDEILFSINAVEYSGRVQG